MDANPTVVVTTPEFAATALADDESSRIGTRIVADIVGAPAAEA